MYPSRSTLRVISPTTSVFQSSGCKSSRLCKATHLNIFKTMKHGLENLKPQQYPGQNATDMSLDVTYHCQALTTAGICDHQLHSSILFTFLLADSDEMYHHSLITMKATLEDELKKVRFVEHATGTSHLHSKGLPTLTSVTLLKLSKGIQGCGQVASCCSHIHPLPSPHTCPVLPKGQPTSCLQDKSHDTCNLCSKTGHWVNKCLNKAHFVTRPCSDTAKPNRCFLGPSQHLGHGNSHGNCGHCQEG